MSDKESIGVVGAGLVGCLAALAFATKGHQVTIFELRPDPKTVAQATSLRSINLAVSDRGIRALKYVDEEMAQRVLENVIPMYGRMIHDLKGKQQSQEYGLFGESINSIDRTFLNNSLMDEIRIHPNITVLFESKLVQMDMSSEFPKLYIEQKHKQKQDATISSFTFDYVIGADGAHSQFRYQLQKTMRMNISQEYIDMQYIELNIPAKAENEFHFSPNHLHIWPRHEFMLIALPNKGGTFTCTFFSPWSVIESIKDEAEFVAFFEKQFPDAVELLGEDQLRESFKNSPRGSLMQISAYPYNHPNGRSIIIGDAAHSMVPFYGQGMNCGFEDVRVLMELIDKEKTIGDAFKSYSVVRKDDLKTICKLAMDNYHEMSSKVTSKLYLIRKNIDYFLGKYGNGKFYSWIPMYTMISFRGDIPYSKAVEIEKRQSKILTGIEFGTLGLFAIIGVAKAAQYLRK